MKKIGVVTICGPLSNFGNQLQNYAVQLILKKLGYQAETIQDVRFCKNPLSIFTFYKAIVHYITRYKYNARSHKKPLSFFFWHKKYIKNAPILIRKTEDEQKLLHYFDGFVVGSDQIWGPLCPWDSSELAFLAFAPEDKRVAFAPSFGSSDIPEDRRQEYVEYLTKFKALSVREHRGAEIIKELTGRDATVLVDPTMLLSVAEWNNIANDGPDFEYVLVYMLGDISQEYKDYIEHTSADNNWKIIDIVNDPNYSGSNPSDFVGLIRESQMVITDSFHGSVFALLYHKSLVLLDRIGTFNMSSRLSTLLNKFEIAYLKEDGISLCKVNNWERFEKVLNVERKQSIDYLKENL